MKIGLTPAQKNMALLARPIVDAFGYQLSECARDYIVKKAIVNTSKIGWLGKILSIPGHMISLHIFNIQEIFNSISGGGYYHLPSGFIKIGEDTDITTYAHELVHFLRDNGLIENDLAGANAVDSYLSDITFFSGEYRYNQEGKIRGLEECVFDMDISRPDMLKPLSLFKRAVSPFIEHTRGYADEGMALGTVASYFEHENGLKGSGLFLIKLVCDGMEIEEAKQKVMSMKELKDWQKVHEKRWGRFRRVKQRSKYEYFDYENLADNVRNAFESERAMALENKPNNLVGYFN